MHNICVAYLCRAYGSARSRTSVYASSPRSARSSICSQLLRKPRSFPHGGGLDPVVALTGRPGRVRPCTLPCRVPRAPRSARNYCANPALSRMATVSIPLSRLRVGFVAYVRVRSVAAFRALLDLPATIARRLPCCFDGRNLAPSPAVAIPVGGRPQIFINFR